MPLRVETASQVEILKAELRAEIRAQDLAEHVLSQQLGYGRSFFTNLFVPPRGKPLGLRVDTLLGVLRLLGIRPSQFFAEVELKWEAVRRRREQRATMQVGTIERAAGRQPDAEEIEQLLRIADRPEELQPEALSRVMRAARSFLVNAAKAVENEGSSARHPARPAKRAKQLTKKSRR